MFFVSKWFTVVSDLVVSSFGVDLEVPLHGHQGATVGSFLRRINMN